MDGGAPASPPHPALRLPIAAITQARRARIPRECKACARNARFALHLTDVGRGDRIDAGGQDSVDKCSRYARLGNRVTLTVNNELVLLALLNPAPN